MTNLEGLTDPVRKAIKEGWIEDRVLECSYCQQGHIMKTAYLLSNNPDQSETDIDENMSNLCGTYQ